MFDKAIKIFAKIAQFLGNQLSKILAKFDKENDEKNLKDGKIDEVSKQTKDLIRERIFNMKERTLAKQFYPQNWLKISPFERELIAQAQIEKLKNVLCLTQDYKVEFVDVEKGGIDGFLIGQKESPRMIYLDKNTFINSPDLGASIMLYSRLAQEMIYGKQQEAMNGEIKVPDKILQLYQTNYGQGPISTQQLYFLGEKIEPMQGEGSYYIKPAYGDTMTERDYFNMMQFAEREPKRFSEAKVTLLEKRMKEDGYLPTDEELESGVQPSIEQIGILETFTFYHDTDYADIREKMNALFQCNVEKELDKALLNINLPEEERQKVNFQVQFATSFYQLQGQAEEDGKEVIDPRRVIINNTHGYIPQMLEKTYERNKGRLEHEGIVVGKVIGAEEAKKERSKSFNNASKKLGQNVSKQNPETELTDTGTDTNSKKYTNDIKTHISDDGVVTTIDPADEEDLEAAKLAFEMASKYAQMLEEEEKYIPPTDQEASFSSLDPTDEVSEYYDDDYYYSHSEDFAPPPLTDADAPPENYNPYEDLDEEEISTFC